ncbi:MAG: thiamine pyrophosphate-binding protein, partial [Stellaceae bacterium]
MKDLIKQYLDQGISRRTLMAGLSSVGMSTVAAKAMAQSLAPFANSAKAAEPQGTMRQMTGTGGALYVQQLKAAGVQYIFCNPSTGDAPVYDALVDEPAIQLIKGIQEGAVTAMADGYARLSGKTAIVQVANVGLPNAMTQMVNTFKDRIPMMVFVASFGQDQLGREGPQDYDYQEYMMSPITKYRWTAQAADVIPETTRRVLKFAATPPCGPVFLSIPDNELRTPATATIMDEALFDVSMQVRPDQADVERAARMLMEAKNPLLSVGDEITLCRGEKEVLELAELLGLPVSGQAEFGVWSKPFPTRNPLYIGPTQRDMRFPGAVDVHLNIGNRYAEVPMRGAKLISIRQDAISLARVTPVDLAMVADVRLATIDLIAAIKSMATASRLKEMADERARRTAKHTKTQWEFLQQMAKAGSGGSTIRRERLALELERGLDKEAIYVT